MEVDKANHRFEWGTERARHHEEVIFDRGFSGPTLGKSKPEQIASLDDILAIATHRSLELVQRWSSRRDDAHRK